MSQQFLAAVTLQVYVAAQNSILAGRGWNTPFVPRVGSKICLVLGKEGEKAIYLPVVTETYYPVPPPEMSALFPGNEHKVLLKLNGDCLNQDDIDQIINGENPNMLCAWKIQKIEGVSC